jgi:hypothetical protein
VGAHKPILMLLVLVAVIAVAVWGAITSNAAEGSPQPNQPAMTGNSNGDDGNGEAANDDGDGSITPAEAEQAKAAALAIAGGGTVHDFEKGDDGNPGWYEVEIQKADGSEVKVQLDENFKQRQAGEAEDADGDGEEPNDD